MSARRIGALATIAFPVTFVVADFLRIRGEAGAVGDNDTVESILTHLAAVGSGAGPFTLASWLFYVAALLTIPTVVFLWRVAVERSPRWAWAAAVLGACAVIGQIAHCMGYFAPLLALSGIDHSAGAEAFLALSTHGYSLAVFMPYLIGLTFFPPVAVIALWRAQVTPRWAAIVTVLGSIAYIPFAGPWWVTAGWAATLLVGFAPAVRLGLRAGSAAVHATRPQETLSSLS